MYELCHLIIYYLLIASQPFPLLCRPKSTVKLVLLDEADAMTKDAQFALRRGLSLKFFYFVALILQIPYCLYFCDFSLHEVIEKHTKSTRFALICNHVNKIIPALQSRCTRFRFAPLDSSNIRERTEHVIKAEGWGFLFILIYTKFDQLYSPRCWQRCISFSYNWSFVSYFGCWPSIVSIIYII